MNQVDEFGFGFFPDAQMNSHQKPPPEILSARIPTRVHHWRQLLTTLQRELMLPDHFNLNWTSLEECLKDFSWLTSFRGVQMRHDGLPLRFDDEQAAIYLNILSDTIRNFENSPSFKFEVLFPESDRARIRRVLNASRASSDPTRSTP